MSERYQDKFRVQSSRAAWWDYRWAASYFITICTKMHLHYFGEIINGSMQLTSAGLLAETYWHEIPKHADHVELGEFVVMPNHIHGILILNGNGYQSDNDPVETRHAPVETRHALSLQQQQCPETTSKSIVANRFQNQGKNTVSSIIGSYKSAVTREANQLKLNMAWQSRFHDHIIRNENEFNRISDYIQSNTRNWENDKFFKG
jgi:putative transposase